MACLAFEKLASNFCENVTYRAVSLVGHVSLYHPFLIFLHYGCLTYLILCNIYLVFLCCNLILVLISHLILAFYVLHIINQTEINQ